MGERTDVYCACRINCVVRAYAVFKTGSRILMILHLLKEGYDDVKFKVFECKTN